MRSSSKTKLFVDAGPISTQHISGIGHATLELVRNLSTMEEFRRDYDLVLFGSVRARTQLKKLKIPGVKFALLPLPTRVLNRLPGTWFAPFLDILIGRGVYLFTNYRNWPLLHSPSITFIYDVSFITHPETVGARNRRFLAGWVPRWILRSTMIAVISRSAEQEIRQHFHVETEKLVYVPCGVDMEHFYARPISEVRASAHKYSLPSDYILYLGNIEPRKNLTRLIRAYCALPVDLKAAHPLLLVGGGGWQGADIDEEIAAAQRLGERIIRPQQYIQDEDLPALYSGAAMLAHPAIYEGFGLTPLQAMACGAPAMVGDNSSMPEVVGDAALLVDVTSQQQMTHTMATMLTDTALRSRLRSRGPQRALIYSWKSSVALLLEAINRINISK